MLPQLLAAPLGMLPQLLAAALALSYFVRAALRRAAHTAVIRSIGAVKPVPSPGRVAGAVVLIANPIAGMGDGVAIARAICALARRMGCRAEVRESSAVGHARELAERVARAGFTHVLSVGGDGQLHEVLNGLHDARALDGVRVGIVPEGTGNGVSTSLGLHSAADAARALAADEIVLLDLWEVEMQPPAFRPTVCALSIGWGAVADIDALAEREWRWLGPLRTTLIAAGVAARHRGVRGSVWFTPTRAPQAGGRGLSRTDQAELERAIADGLVRASDGGPHGCTHVIEDDFFLVHACNVASIARDCLMAPGARPTDGSLTLCVVRQRGGRLASIRALLSLHASAAAALPSGRAGAAGPQGEQRLERYACAQLALVPAEPHALFAIDGEPLVAQSLHAARALGARGRPQVVRVLAPPEVPPVPPSRS